MTKKVANDVQFRLKDSFVAPWGLSNEERPFHFIWEGEVERVEITLPDPVNIEDLFNVSGEIEDYVEFEKIGDREVKILKVESDKLIKPGYISAIFTVEHLFDEPIVGKVIEAEFDKGDGVEKVKELTFTVRPMIRIVELPERINLYNDTVEVVYDGEDGNVERTDYPGIIKADMEQIGFGTAQVEAEAWGEGELLSQEESVYQDLAKALINSVSRERSSLSEVPEEAEEEYSVEIPDETVKNTIDGFREWLSNDSLVEDLDSEEIEEISDYIEAEGTEYDMSAMYKHFEYLLMNSILDVVDRHPSENVQMNSPQTKIEIESRINSFNICFKLSDNVSNEYESEVIEIDIQDERDDGGIAMLELETNWSEVQLDPSQLDQLKDEIESDL